MKSAIHEKLVVRERERYEKQNQVDKDKAAVEEMSEYVKIYESLLSERKRILVNSYLMKNQDDLERILETLHQHFQFVQGTSFDSLAKDNLDYVGSRAVLSKSNTELRRLLKELTQQKLEKDDLRYDIFKMIYEMIEDDIQLRLKLNNYAEGILEQTNQKLEKFVNYFQKQSVNEDTGPTPGATLGEEESTHGEFEKRKQLRTLNFEDKNKKDKNRMCI